MKLIALNFHRGLAKDIGMIASQYSKRKIKIAVDPRNIT
jgi:hypothetical protein